MRRGEALTTSKPATGEKPARAPERGRKDPKVEARLARERDGKPDNRRGAKPDRTPTGARAEKLERAARPERAAKPERTGHGEARSFGPGKPGGAPRPDRAGKPDRAARSDGAGRPDRAVRPDRNERPDRIERPRRGAGRVAPPPPAAPREPDPPQRIAKLLARAGIASRRDIERMIEEGRVSLNGEVVTTPATILTGLDGLTVDGNPVAKPVSTRLYRFHKPAGCLTAANDPKGRTTIYDVMPAGLPRLMPVGRLDYNTEGLLLLTTDGEFKRQLELPSSGVERTYRARAFGDISQTQLEDLAEGITIEGIRYGKIDANLERRTGRNTWIEMTLTEGKNREVRKVLEHFGLQVSRLIRTDYGPFSLGNLAIGAVDVVDRDILFQYRRMLG